MDSGALRTFLESDFEKKKKDNVKSGFPTSPTVTLAHAQNVTLDNTPLLCSHLKLDVDSMSTTKRISQSGYDVLTQLGYSINPVLKTEDICHDCFIQQVRTVYWDLQHERDTATLRSFKYKKDEPKFAISKAWLQGNIILNCDKCIY